MHRIMVIDDEAMIRESLKKILESKGYQVRVACDGNEASIMFDEEAPDLVITDILMPEKDGVEVILELRRKFLNIKILAISGGGRINAINHLEVVKHLGADATLPKPFTADQLLSEVSRLISSI